MKLSGKQILILDFERYIAAILKDKQCNCEQLIISQKRQKMMYSPDRKKSQPQCDNSSKIKSKLRLVRESEPLNAFTTYGFMNGLAEEEVRSTSVQKKFRDSCRIGKKNIEEHKKEIKKTNSQRMENILKRLQQTIKTKPNKIESTQSQKVLPSEYQLREKFSKDGTPHLAKHQKLITQISQKINQHRNITIQKTGKRQHRFSHAGNDQKGMSKSKANDHGFLAGTFANIKHGILKETVSTTYSEKERSTSLSEFKVLKAIGEGKFSKCFAVLHNLTGFIFALKVIAKETVIKENCYQQLARQIKIQLYMNHINIVKLYTFFHDSKKIYLLQEYCPQGQMYTILRMKQQFREEQLIPIIKGICEGMYELHNNHIIHRDIKPQNIFLSFGMPKIGDFGWSVHVNSQSRTTFCGTPLYISPQIIKGEVYDRKVDIWAMGVMFFQLLTGRIPFQINTQKQLMKIVNTQIEYPSFLSIEAVNLLSLLLEKDPDERIEVVDILDHALLNKKIKVEFRGK